MTLDYFTQIFFMLFSILILLRGLYVILKGNNIAGKPPINLWFFILSKLCAMLVIIYPLWLTLGLKNHPIINHRGLIFMGIVIYFIGMTLFLISLYNLNPLSLKFGLPKEKTPLQKNGLYRLSRNPIYLSLFIIFFGSILSTQNMLVLFCTIISTYIHIKIIILEESYLRDQFGLEWLEYKKQVRRFL